MTLGALAAAREMARTTAAEAHLRLFDMSGARVVVSEPAGPCPYCGEPMRVQKTRLRTGRTKELGSFSAWETVHVCARRCRHPSGELVTHHPEGLTRRLPPGAVIGYDVLVHVGLARFLDYRQRDEIRAELEREHDLRVSEGEVSDLCRRFLHYLRALHEDRSPALAAALRSDGGWPLHVDATGECGRGTLLAIYTGWRDWVLAAFKIPTERADAILPRLLEVAQRFGDPCAVMRDLGRAMIPAAAAFVAQRSLEIPVLSCHQHFLADLGRDILEKDHDALRKAFRKSGLKTALRRLARDLGRALGHGIDAARRALEKWQTSGEPGHHLPEGPEGIAVVRGLAQWVLDYQADSTYQRFPYDRPWLDFYRRSLTGHRAADAFLRHPPDDPAVLSALNRLYRALDPIVTDQGLTLVAAALKRHASLFDELRDVLRIFPKSAKGGVAGSPERRRTIEEDLAATINIRSDLECWTEGLVQRRPARGPAEDTRQVIDEILLHIERHGDSLWGHAVALPPEAGGGFRLVSRTNNQQENSFHVLKHGERRRSGRKILTHDFEALPAEAALAMNLRHDDYVKILCGSLADLPQAFARLDQQRRDAERAGLPVQPIRQEGPGDEVETASLPTPDRRVVRTGAMDRKVRAAARSRAPRNATRAG